MKSVIIAHNLIEKPSSKALMRQVFEEKRSLQERGSRIKAEEERERERVRILEFKNKC